MKKISVIVPIYKVEKYICRCIDSIINQTYKNLEIILVDDGSPDTCPSICDEYAKKDNRIKVIHKENGGLSDARNRGLEMATGELVSFIDSDDYIHEKMYEILVKEMERNNSDIVICESKDVFNEDDFRRAINENYDTLNLTNIEAVEKICDGQKPMIYTIACNKLYKRQLFEDIRYPVGKINEDAFTTYKLLFKSDRTTYIDCVLYYYYQRVDSIMRTTVAHRNLDIIEALKEREVFLRENDLNNLILFNDRMIFIWLISLYNDFKRQKFKKEVLMLKCEYKNLYKKIKKQKNMSLKDKFRYMVVRYIPNLYFLRKKIKIYISKMIR